MEFEIEEILDVLEESQVLFAEIILEDKSAFIPVVTLALATLTKMNAMITAQLNDSMFEDDYTTGESIVYSDLSEPVYGVHDKVIEAVIAACNSCTNGDLKEWEIDNIMTAIVENHTNKKLIKATNERKA